MALVYVESSNILAIEYYPDTSILEIEFRNGSAYEYYDVPQYEHDNIMAAESKGTYAHQNIYKAYRQQKIR